MELNIRFATDIGRNPHRDMNEDAVLADAVPLVAVADGMGGHEAGEVASNLAVDVLRTWKEKLEAAPREDVEGVLREAFNEVNRAVFTKGEEDEAVAGMGTTLTAGWFSDDTLTVAHVGDSRLYLLRGTNLQQITEDQTVAQELVRRGRIREDELESSPQRHYLLQAIGIDGDLNIATSAVKLRPGDRFIFATDGVYGMLQDPEQIKQILLAHSDAQDACDVLVQAANQAGGLDNISVVIVDVPGDPDAGADDVDDDDEPVVERREPVAQQPPTRRSIRRWVVLAGAVLLLVVMAVVFVLRPATSSLVVASQRDNVVVLEGRPGRTENDPARGDVVHTFVDTTPEQFPSTIQRELRSGIVVESLAEANEVVRRLPRVKPAIESPTPRPTAKPTPDGSASPKPEKTA
jgi:PPM family protein phosphatase